MLVYYTDFKLMRKISSLNYEKLGNFMMFLLNNLCYDLTRKGKIINGQKLAAEAKPSIIDEDGYSGQPLQHSV